MHEFTKNTSSKTKIDFISNHYFMYNADFKLRGSEQDWHKEQKKVHYLLFSKYHAVPSVARRERNSLYLWQGQHFAASVGGRATQFTRATSRYFTTHVVSTSLYGCPWGGPPLQVNPYE